MGNLDQPPRPEGGDNDPTSVEAFTARIAHILDAAQVVPEEGRQEGKWAVRRFIRFPHDGWEIEVANNCTIDGSLDAYILTAKRPIATLGGHRLVHNIDFDAGAREVIERPEQVIVFEEISLETFRQDAWVEVPDAVIPQSLLGQLDAVLAILVDNPIQREYTLYDAEWLAAIQQTAQEIGPDDSMPQL